MHLIDTLQKAAGKVENNALDKRALSLETLSFIVRKLGEGRRDGEDVVELVAEKHSVRVNRLAASRNDN